MEDISVTYSLRRGFISARRRGHALKAVDRVSLSVRRGRSLGLVGETGSGKSTIAKVIMGMVSPTEGAVKFASGEDATSVDASVHGRFVQVVLQDPYSSLDPRMTIGEIISEPLTLGRRNGRRESSEAASSRIADLLRLVGLPASAADRYPSQFSGGQRQRIAVARALGPQPELIVLDEPTSALDASIKAQILNLLKDLQQELGVTYLMISHDLPTVAYLASDLAVMYRGRIVEVGPAKTLFRDPEHPYTRELLASVPGAARDMEVEELQEEEEGLASAVSRDSDADDSDRCSYSGRCALRKHLDSPAECVTVEPLLRSVSAGHQAACHFVGRGR